MGYQDCVYVTKQPSLEQDYETPNLCQPLKCGVKVDVKSVLAEAWVGKQAVQDPSHIRHHLQASKCIIFTMDDQIPYFFMPQLFTKCYLQCTIYYRFHFQTMLNCIQYNKNS